jgi:hypothetical protein
MKSIRISLLVCICTFAIYFLSSCTAQRGCPSNGKNVGAERLLSGEKVPKAKKFRS